MQSCSRVADICDRNATLPFPPKDRQSWLMLSSLPCLASTWYQQELQLLELYPTTEARAQPCFDPLRVPREASSCSAPDNHITTEHILMTIFGVKKQQWPVTRWFHCLQSLERTEGFPSGLAKSTGHSPHCNSERLQPTQLSYVSSSTHLTASNPTPLCPSPMGNFTVKASAIAWPRGGRILWDKNLLPPLERHHSRHSSQCRPRLVTTGNKTGTNLGRYRGMSSRTLIH